MDEILKEIEKTKMDPRFGICQEVDVCPRCMRNIDPVYDERCLDEYISIGEKHILAGAYCPHCGLPAKPKIYSVN